MEPEQKPTNKKMKARVMEGEKEKGIKRNLNRKEDYGENESHERRKDARRGISRKEKRKEESEGEEEKR